MNVVVTGWIAPVATPAQFWHSMGFALGSRELGHEVWFVEDSGDHPEEGWDIAGNRADPDCRGGVAVLECRCRALGLEEGWAFRHVPSGRHDGMTADQVATVLAAAEVLVNVSLMTPMRGEYRRIPHRLAINTDLVLTQAGIATRDPAVAWPKVHTRLFTLGRLPLPSQPDEWLPTRQPEFLPQWQPTPPLPDRTGFSTIMTWRAHEPVSRKGHWYAAEDLSWKAFLDLPAGVGHPLAVAVGGRGATVHLAGGLPAVVQETGWTDWSPAGEGLLPFSGPSEAVATLEEVAAASHRHAVAARRIVEEHFTAARVRDELLERL